jgi:hypothetical protein
MKRRFRRENNKIVPIGKRGNLFAAISETERIIKRHIYESEDDRLSRRGARKAIDMSLDFDIERRFFTEDSKEYEWESKDRSFRHD